MLSLNIESVVGKSKERSWSQVLQFRDGEKSRGVVMRIRREQGETGILDLGSIGSSTFTKLQEGAGEWLTRVKSEVEELSGQGFNVTAIAFECINLELRIWASGGGRAYLGRGGKLARLVGPTQEESNIQGAMKEGDMYVWGVTGQKELVGLEQLEKAMREGEKAKEIIAGWVHGTNETRDVAMLIGRVARLELNEEVKKWKMPSLKISRMQEEPKKFNLVFGGSVIAIVVLLTIVGGVYKVNKNTRITFEGKQQEVNTLLAEAETTVETNPERAKMLLAQASDIWEGYLKEAKNEEYRRQAQQLRDGLKIKEQTLLKVRGVSLATTLELAIIQEGLAAERMRGDGDGNIYFWDEEGNQIAGINLRDKSKLMIEVEGGRKLGAFAVQKGRYVGVTEEGVVEINNKEQKVVILRDELWGEIGQIGLFGGNVYMLDLGNSEIWKYSALTEGYADRKRWLAAGIVLDLTKVVDWVVDGDIWILTASGKLERYSRGAPTKFELSGFPSTVGGGRLADPIAIAVVEDKVYVLERGAKRVVMFDTQGKYLGQKVAEELGRATDLEIYGNKGYVLVDNVVKEFEID